MFYYAMVAGIILLSATPGPIMLGFQHYGKRHS